MKLDEIVIIEKVVTAKTFLYETFGLSNLKHCKFYELSGSCSQCPCLLSDGCAMKIIYHKLD